MSLREARLGRLRAARLYAITDDRLSRDELESRLVAILEAGVRVVQFRAPRLQRRELLDGASRVREICRRYGSLFIVNDAADVAALLDADGLHVGQDDLPLPAARRLVGPSALIGLSVSAIDEARAAAADSDVDYLGVGAIYPTDTKPDAEYGGLELLRSVREAVALPLVAIGGITADRAAEVWSAGADLIAVVSALFGAADPGQAARDLLATGQPPARGGAAESNRAFDG